eukprot:364521-Chlamydomonas_euryale.AAC.6
MVTQSCFRTWSLPASHPPHSGQQRWQGHGAGKDSRGAHHGDPVLFSDLIAACLPPSTLSAGRSVLKADGLACRWTKIVRYKLNRLCDQCDQCDSWVVGVSQRMHGSQRAPHSVKHVPRLRRLDAVHGIRNVAPQVVIGNPVQVRLDVRLDLKACAGG